MPFVLFLQSLLFASPHAVWCNWEGGLVRGSLTGLKDEIRGPNRDKLQTLASYFAARLHTFRMSAERLLRISTAEYAECYYKHFPHWPNSRWQFLWIWAVDGSVWPAGEWKDCAVLLKVGKITCKAWVLTYHLFSRKKHSEQWMWWIKLFLSFNSMTNDS